MMENLGRDIARMMSVMMWLIVLFVPLGIYQAWQIIYWLFTHIRFGG